MEVARALAGNTRAVVQLGDASELLRIFMLQDNAPAVGRGANSDGAVQNIAAADGATENVPAPAQDAP